MCIETVSPAMTKRNNGDGGAAATAVATSSSSSGGGGGLAKAKKSVDCCGVASTTSSSRGGKGIVGRAGSSSSLVNKDDWGYPGHLTSDQKMVFDMFRKEVFTRSDSFRSTVFCFEEANEDEDYALCRWLRARRFHLHETLLMVEEAENTRKEAAQNEFYRDPRIALGGVDPSIVQSQYPQLYPPNCYSKEGCPVFIAKPGVLNMGALECVTTLEGLSKFHWHCIMHCLVRRLRAKREVDPNFKRYGAVCIIDLANLTASQVSRGALDIFKANLQVDSICFPETLNRVIIVNAPSFFPMTWKMVKQFLDPRTASKIEIVSSPSKWRARLHQLIDPTHLPSDYGGKGDSTSQILSQMARKEGSDVNGGGGDGGGGGTTTTKLLTKFITASPFTSNKAAQFHAAEGEMLQLSVLSTMHGMAEFIVSSSKSGKIRSKTVCRGESFNVPTQMFIGKPLDGPGMYKVSIRPESSFETYNFLLVGKVMASQKAAEEPKDGGVEMEGIETSVVERGEIETSATTEKVEGGTTELLPPLPVSPPDELIVLNDEPQPVAAATKPSSGLCPTMMNTNNVDLTPTAEQVDKVKVQETLKELSLKFSIAAKDDDFRVPSALTAATDNTEKTEQGEATDDFVTVKDDVLYKQNINGPAWSYQAWFCQCFPEADEP